MHHLTKVQPYFIPRIFLSSWMKQKNLHELLWQKKKKKIPEALFTRLVSKVLMRTDWISKFQIFLVWNTFSTLSFVADSRLNRPWQFLECSANPEYDQFPFFPCQILSPQDVYSRCLTPVTTYVLLITDGNAIDWLIFSTYQPFHVI